VTFLLHVRLLGGRGDLEGQFNRRLVSSQVAPFRLIRNPHPVPLAGFLIHQGPRNRVQLGWPSHGRLRDLQGEQGFSSLGMRPQSARHRQARGIRGNALWVAGLVLHSLTGGPLR
jgi:hypothetical protein